MTLTYISLTGAKKFRSWRNSLDGKKLTKKVSEQIKKSRVQNYMLPKLKASDLFY